MEPRGRKSIFGFAGSSDGGSQSASRNNSLDRSPQRARPTPVHHSSSHGSGRHFLITEPDTIDSPSSTHHHHHLVALDEEAALEGDGYGSGSDRGRTERSSLLNKSTGVHTVDRNGSPRRRVQVNSSPARGYGATAFGNHAPASSTHDVAGAALKRSESILRVAGLIDDRMGEYERFRKSDEELAKMSKKVRKFYQRQNETLVSQTYSIRRLKQCSYLHCVRTRSAKSTRFWKMRARKP